MHTTLIVGNGLLGAAVVLALRQTESQICWIRPDSPDGIGTNPADDSIPGFLLPPTLDDLTAWEAWMAQYDPQGRMAPVVRLPWESDTGDQGIAATVDMAALRAGLHDLAGESQVMEEPLTITTAPDHGRVEVRSPTTTQGGQFLIECRDHSVTRCAHREPRRPDDTIVRVSHHPDGTRYRVPWGDGTYLLEMPPWDRDPATPMHRASRPEPDDMCWIDPWSVSVHTPTWVTVTITSANGVLGIPQMVWWLRDIRMARGSAHG